ncbi:MAG TPA: nucleotidyltransferase domain-containing protein [Candidatus Limnocylindrales bacterium]|nr:nucleotidyltransferase domain-containing protein [Candidatus Limnocylindrales bacterium]
MSDVLLRNLDELRRRVAPHVVRARKVIAFGSVARGEADAGSDLDLIIIADTTRPFFERFKDFAGLYDVWPRLDLLIYTPEEFASMVAEERPLISQALQAGVVLHETA